MRKARALLGRGKSFFVKQPQMPAQLEMLWPDERLGSPPEVRVPGGFRLRTYCPGDEVRLIPLHERAGMHGFPVKYWMEHILPEGLFFIEHEDTRRLVATCMASHHPTERHPFGGNLGWLSGDPDFQGRGLGYAVAAAVTRRLVQAGYRRIYLETHDFRLPAIRIYLKMGWLPFLFQEDMLDRWHQVCRQLDWKFSPAQWPSTL